MLIRAWVHAVGGAVLCVVVLGIAETANPFDLRGPAFLIFYAALCVASISVLPIAPAHLERGPVPRIPVNDPLVVAYLRGGPAEAIRVATMGLVDRDYLLPDGKDELKASKSPADFAGSDLERACLAYCSPVGSVRGLFRDPDCQGHCESLRAPLEKAGAVPNPIQIDGRRMLLAVVLAVLIGIAFAKIAVGLSRGHKNVQLLIGEAVLAAYVAVRLHDPVRTPVGDALLRDVRELFASLRARATGLEAGTKPAELVWLVAVFGTQASEVGAGYFERIFGHRRGRSGGCGSVGSCGGGGGCGGGGCGGCGGCGS